MLLSDVKDFRVGADQAKAVYVGETKIWPPETRTLTQDQKSDPDSTNSMSAGGTP